MQLLKDDLRTSSHPYLAPIPLGRSTLSHGHAIERPRVLGEFTDGSGGGGALVARVVLPYIGLRQMHSVAHATQIIRVGAPRVELNARTRTRHPHVVIADVDLAANVLVFEEFWGEDRNEVLFVIDACDRHA